MIKDKLTYAFVIVKVLFQSFNLSHTDELNIEGEVSSSDKINCFEIITGTFVLTLLRFIIWIVVRHTLGEISNKVSCNSQILNPLLILLFQRLLAIRAS